MKVRDLMLISLLMVTANIKAQEYSATYRVTFVSEWTSQSHPTDFPGGAHFSPLIGSTHNTDGMIWSPGEFATAGVELMAETGGTSILRNEINALINTGHSENLITGRGSDAVDMVSIEFEVSYSHPLVSLVTMIAPSPDWFVGVHGVDLIENKFWVDEVMYDLLPYDSGTDSGVSFTSSNIDTNPAEPISLITTTPLDNGVPLATLLFERLTVTGTSPDVVFVSDFD